MENLPLPNDYCSTECDPAANKAITGPLTLCTGSGGPATYTSPIQGTGYTYTWSASPASAFTVASGSGPTFQTANAPGVNAPATITLTVNTGCQLTFSKNITVGAPAEPNYQQRDAQDVCYSGTAYYNILNYDPGVQYSIQATGARGIIDPGGFRLKGGSGYVTFTLTAQNACGTTSVSGDLTIECPRAYAIYPNPADDALTVEQTDSTGTQRTTAARGTTAASSSAAPGPPYTVRLFDSYGVQQAQQATTTPTLSLPTGALPTGLYLLHIEVNGAVVERRRLQITH